jgi:hypothetical protein
MAKHHAAGDRVHLEEVHLLRWGEVVDVRMALCGSPDGGQAGVRLQRGEQQQSSGPCGQRPDVGGKRSLQPPVQREACG